MGGCCIVLGRPGIFIWQFISGSPLFLRRLPKGSKWKKVACCLTCVLNLPMKERMRLFQLPIQVWGYASHMSCSCGVTIFACIDFLIYAISHSILASSTDLSVLMMPPVQINNNLIISLQRGQRVLHKLAPDKHEGEMAFIFHVFKAQMIYSPPCIPAQLLQSAAQRLTGILICTL